MSSVPVVGTKAAVLAEFSEPGKNTRSQPSFSSVARETFTLSVALVSDFGRFSVLLEGTRYPASGVR